MAVDLEPDEHGQAEAGPRPADLGAIPGDDPVGLQCLHAAQAGRRGQSYRVGEVDVGDPAVPLQLGNDGTIHLVWHVYRHVHMPMVACTQFCGAAPWYRADICHRMRADLAKT